MFGLFDLHSIDRHLKTIDFVEHSGERHKIQLRGAKMTEQVRECVLEQPSRRIMGAELKQLPDGKKTLAQVGVATYAGMLRRSSSGVHMRVDVVNRRGVQVKIEPSQRVNYPIETAKPLDDVLPVDGFAAAYFIGYLAGGKINCFHLRLPEGPITQNTPRP
jgi:hypothetical protein